MQEKHLFEYAVIRVVPRVEREEFINAGVVLYCPKERFLKAQILLDEQRLGNLSPTCDRSAIKDHLNAFERICAGGRAAGPIGELTPAERFRWLTAMRSTMIQTSRVHPGLCSNAAETLDRLFEEMVTVKEMQDS